MRKGLEKAYEITDAKISFVSLVDKRCCGQYDDGSDGHEIDRGRIGGGDAISAYP